MPKKNSYTYVGEAARNTTRAVKCAASAYREENQWYGSVKLDVTDGQSDSIVVTVKAVR